MTSAELRERVAKAEEAIAKKEKLIEKYHAKAEKIRAQIVSRGWDVEAGRYQREGFSDHNDCYWLFCDLSDAESGAKNAERALREKRATLEMWQGRLAKAVDVEDEQAKFPAVLREYQEQVVSDWDAWDLDRQKRLREEYEAMRAADTSRNRMDSYNAFIDKHKYAGYEVMRTSFEEIHRENVKSAEALIMNLWKRVREIVGENPDWANLWIRQGNEWEGAVVNGVVRGDSGSADVSTIGAGGYNIQKFHYRTLVHKIG